MHSAQAYQDLVSRLTTLAATNPGRYKLQLALLAVAGFAVLGGAVALALALAAGTIALMIAGKSIVLLKIGLLALVFAWVLLKSMWIRLEEPAGERLQFTDAPALSAEIERLRVAAGAPPLEGVVFTPELNAAAASVPRLLGLLGSRHFLVIGLPLMQRLDRGQFAAVLAHEFGHFGGGHSHFAGWIYRVRASWYRVCDGLQQSSSWFAGPMIRFFNWYAPYFNAYSFVLARQNEYEADATAARIVGAGPAAQALVSIELASMRLDRDFWPAVNRATRAEPEPPRALYSNLGQTLLMPGADDQTRLAEALRRESDLDDTHPVLAQRLAALGQPAALPAPPALSAADELLGDFHAVMSDRFSQEWRARVSPDWEQLFQVAGQKRERLQALEEAWTTRAPAPGETGEHACLVAELRPGEEAKGLLARAIEVDTDHAEAHYLHGCLLLDGADAAGEAALERAIALDSDFAEAALQRMHQWRWTSIGREAAAPIAERLRALFEARREGERERLVLAAGDSFLAHGLDAGKIADIHHAVADFRSVGSLWFARKQMQHRPGVPHYIVLVKWRAFSRSNDYALRQLADRLPLDGSWLVVTDAALSGHAKAFRAAAGEPVYKRS